MPEIPVYRQRVDIPSAQGSRIPLSMAGNMGAALAGIGEKLAKISEEKDKSEALTTAQDILNETRLGVENDLDVLRRSGMNSEQYQESSRAVFKKWTDRSNERSREIKTAEGQTYLAQKLGEFSINTQIRLGAEFDKKFKDEQRAGVLMQLPEIEQRAIRAQTPEETQSAIDELHQFLGTHTGYALTVEEATKQYLESVDKIREQRFRAAILGDPVGALNLLASDAGKDLKAEQVERLTRLATAKLTANEAEQRRKEAEVEREQKKIQKGRSREYVRDILKGNDVLERLENERDLDGPEMRALADWQKSRAAHVEDASDPGQLLRWRIASRTGRDPQTGKGIKWTDITKAPGLNSKDKGDLVDRLVDRAEKLEGKAETLLNRRIGRGDSQIRLLLSGTDGLVARMTGTTGDEFNDFNMYEAIAEFDARVGVGKDAGRDPVDLADEIAFKYAGNVIAKYKGSAQKIIRAYGVDTIDELLDKVQSGQFPKKQADFVLRMGKFLKDANKPAQSTPTKPGEPPAALKDGQGALDSFKTWIFGEGGSRQKGPSKGE